MVKDGGAVLRAPVGALAVELSGVVVLPENFQQVGVVDLDGVEFDFDGFGMAGAIGADIFVGGTVGLAAGIADTGRLHTGQGAEGSFDSPETSGCECGFFHDGS